MHIWMMIRYFKAMGQFCGFLKLIVGSAIGEHGNNRESYLWIIWAVPAYEENALATFGFAIIL